MEQPSKIWFWRRLEEILSFGPMRRVHNPVHRTFLVCHVGTKTHSEKWPYVPRSSSAPCQLPNASCCSVSMQFGLQLVSPLFHNLFWLKYCLWHANGVWIWKYLIYIKEFWFFIWAHLLFNICKTWHFTLNSVLSPLWFWTEWWAFAH